MQSVKKMAPAQMALAIGLFVTAILVVWWLNSDSDSDDLVENSRKRWFVCSDTGKPFRLEMTPETTLPAMSPHSGKPTGYLAELCYWTKDGKSASKPTPVLLNEKIGRPGATFCPDCGRLVVAHNPMPGGAKPPPTQAEYSAPGGSKSARQAAAR